MLSKMEVPRERKQQRVAVFSWSRSAGQNVGGRLRVPGHAGDVGERGPRAVLASPSCMAPEGLFCLQK